MRFVYHHRTAGRGGEGVHITSVVQALTAAGHVVHVVSPPGSDPARAVSSVPLDKGNRETSRTVRLWRWVSCSCPQVVFELIEILYNVYAAVRLLFEFASKKPDVYYQRHAFFLIAGVWIARLFGKPVILEVNDVAGIERARGQRFVRLARWIEGRAFRGADEIIVVSSLLQRIVLERGGRVGHVHVVPNAIDPERFRHGARDAVRERLGLGQARVLGCVGWFDRRDRLDRLLDLVRSLRQITPPVRLLLVGDGPEASNLSNRLAQEGLDELVVLCGPVPRADIPDLIAAMDICILVDANEFCSPLVLFEFMAMGKPVVVPDVEPMRDVLTHETTGWIVTRHNPIALRAAVERVLSDPALALRVGNAAKRNVLDHHTWSAVATFVGRLATEQLAIRTRALHDHRVARVRRPDRLVLRTVATFFGIFG
jgi:glycosyltransferase involved in cell wall biosynthesis